MTAFHEVQFPPSISYGAVGGPSFSTTVLGLASGHERRNVNWSRSRAVYDVAQGLKDQGDLDTLLKFFYARGGKAYGFRFKDWSDYELPFAGDALTTFMTTDGGTTTTFQLSKTYTSGPTSYVRTITKPVSGSLLVYADAVLTADWTANYATGIVTLTGALVATTGKVITASCEFDVPVRFNTDEMKTTLNDIDNFSWGSIPLIEVRV